MKKIVFLIAFGLQMAFGLAVMAQVVDPATYPAADEKEWGQLLWNLKLANQDLADFTHYRSVDQQGISANRYTISFASYFLALEQYHKFPAWREAIQPAFDRLIRRMLQKPVWEYWANESFGITKFEPNMDRPYASSSDPVGYANIMYSGHLGMMINLYQMLYHDMKWDQPGSIVFRWDEKTQFVYDNRRLQEVMFIQNITNPVPGIECERNAIFPACNTHPIISYKLYDQMHNTRFFEAATSVYNPWCDSVFINPVTKDFASFYLIKQGWAFSGWNPRYGNKMDAVMAEMVKKGVDFNSGGNDGWIGTFMHAWRPELIENNYPYLKRKHYKLLPGGTAVLTKDVIAPDAYYAFFTALAAEVGDEEARTALLKTVDSIYSPVWEDGTYRYPFMDDVPTVNLAAADGEKKTETTPSASVKPAAWQKPAGSGSKSPALPGQGDATNMKTFPSHSDLADRLIAIARALPARGLYTMINNPVDAEHFSEPAITGVDITRVILKRAIYDRNKKALVISTFAKSGAGNTSIMLINLDPAKVYAITIDKKHEKDVEKVAGAMVTFDAGKAHDILLKEK
jgi:hypothetical protein